MDAIDIRVAKANTLWQEGQRAEDARDYQTAYQLYTDAHDLVIDCPKLHQSAHEYLRRVNFKTRNYSELATDWALHFLAPLKIFEIVAWFSKSDGKFAAACRR